LIVGSSPVAEIVSELGRLLDFKVCLADPQASKEQFPNADLVLNDLSLVRSRIKESSFVVVATLGNGDEEGLQAVIGATPRYLGLVASEKKARSLFEYIREKGATDEQIAAIKSPAGIKLGGETMPEIALSVMAEITSVRRAGVAETEPATAKSAATEPVEADPAETEPEESSVTRSLEAWDPICGMAVTVQNAKYTSVLDGKTFYFCCLRCKETFEKSNG